MVWWFLELFIFCVPALPFEFPFFPLHRQSCSHSLHITSMSMREQEYVRSAWELAVREGLLPRTPMIEIINALCTNIRKLIEEIRDRGGMIKSDVVWVIIGAVWVDSKSLRVPVSSS